MQRLSKLSKYSHFLIILLYMIVYLSIFYVLEHREVYAFNVVHTVLDDYIPFCEAFIVPYLLWFPYVAVVILFFSFVCPDKTEYFRFTANLIMGMTIFLIVSYAYPNMLELRPEVMPRTNLFTKAVEMLYRSDTPTNVLPSIHVFNSIACHIAVSHCPMLKKHPVARGASMVLALSIVLSTMFLKQHSVVDVCLGIAMAGFGYVLFYGETALETAGQFAVVQSGKSGNK